MKLVVMSASVDYPGEVGEAVNMLDKGLDFFHVRKPRKSKSDLADYIKKFPKEYRSRLVLHSFHDLADVYKLGGIHLSRAHRGRNKFYQFRLWLRRRQAPNFVVTRTFHKLTDIVNDKRTYSYTFLSPVYDSHAQTTLSAGFSQRALHIILPQAKQPVYALGGVSLDNLAKSFENGFHGAVFHGSIWDGESSPSEMFAEALRTVHQLSKI